MRLLMRLAAMALAVLAVSVVVFALMEAAPGDAATQFLGAKATPERLAELREELGLDRAAWVRYLDWVRGILAGDFGYSLISGRPVGDVIAAPAVRTALLAVIAFVGVLLIGVVGGIQAGYRPSGRIDQAVSIVALIGLSMPEFVIGILLIAVFALRLKVLPAVSLLPPSGHVTDRLDVLVLPAATLAIVAGCYVLRLVRGILVAGTNRPNVEAAHLDGIAPARVLLVHIVPSVLGPVVTAAVVTIPYLIGGAIVIEQLFGYPGLGRLMATAVTGRDQPLVMAIALILSILTITGYAVSDVVARATDPYRRSRT